MATMIREPASVLRYTYIASPVRKERQKYCSYFARNIRSTVTNSDAGNLCTFDVSHI